MRAGNSKEEERQGQEEGGKASVLHHRDELHGLSSVAKAADSVPDELLGLRRGRGSEWCLLQR